MKTKTITLALALACLLPAVANAQPGGIERFGPPDGAISSMTAIPAGAKIYFLSGTGGGTPGQPATGDTQAQTVGALTHLQATLKSAGMTMGNVVVLRVFLSADPAKGGADRAGMTAGYKQFFGTADQPNKPARTTIQIASGGGPNFVEIDCIAAKP